MGNSCKCLKLLEACSGDNNHTIFVIIGGSMLQPEELCYGIYHLHAYIIRHMNKNSNNSSSRILPSQRNKG
jgi:hypothetical protein